MGMISSLLSRIDKNPDIDEIERKRNIRRLIRLLTYHDFGIQSRATAALVRIGEPAAKELMIRTTHPNRDIRIGAVEVLGEMKERSALPKLTLLLSGDESSEVRWAAAIALGGIGDPAGIPALVDALRDPDKYVRYGVALALDELHWIPADPEERAYFLIAAQRWDEIQSCDDLPPFPFIHHLRDRDPSLRASCVEVLGRLKGYDAGEVSSTALQDSESSVRWKGILAFPRSGVPLLHIPRVLSRRTRRRKDPYVASFLNFVFVGLGYNYLGFWWGLLLFQVNLTGIVIVAAMIGDPVIPYAASYAVSAVAVVHTWYYVKRLPDI